MNAIKMPEKLHEILTDANFKMNGYGYWKAYGVTDGQAEWNEEVYVSNSGDSFAVEYPARPGKDKEYKTGSGLIKYLKSKWLIN